MFTPRKINLSEINGGARYVDENEVSPEAINRPIEASAYAQEKADEALVKATTAMEKVNDSEIGEITISAYPVGSIYMSINSTSPAELFGGEWQKETRYIECSVSATKVIYINTNEYAIPFATITDVNDMFYTKYGFYLTAEENSLLSVVVYNGDQTAQGREITGAVYSNGIFQFWHNMTVGLNARVNYTFALSRKDPRNHWRRIA